MVLGKLDRHVHENETRPPSAPHTRINSKWVKDLNIRDQTIKILEDSIGSKISDIAHSNILSDTSPPAMETKEKINKWDYIKLKSFLHTRGKYQ